MKLSSLAVALAVTGLVGPSIRSTFAAVQYNVGPGELTADLSSGYGWDGDKQPPIAVSNTGSVDGNSFWSNVTGAGAADPRQYTAFLFTPAALGLPANTTMADITAMSYDTQKAGGTSDWAFHIYTAKANPGDPSFYGYRVHFYPEMAFAPDYTANHDWTTYALNASDASQVYSIKSGATGVETINPGSFSSIQGSAAGTLPIQYFYILAGDGNTGATVDSFLDNIHVETASVTGNSINLVPEPASLSVLALGGVALLARRRRQA